jgi:hypothetical protein
MIIEGIARNNPERRLKLNNIITMNKKGEGE